MEVKEFFTNFNRYFLRYGPNAVVTMLILGSSEFNKILMVDEFTVFSFAIFFFLSLGISYLFTWPMLLFHAFRFGLFDMKTLTVW